MTDSLADLDLVELRSRRDEVRAEETAVSYRRRLLQAQLDIVATYDVDGHSDELSARLAAVLADRPSAGGQEPTRAVATGVEGIDAPEALPDDLPTMTAEQRADLTGRLATAEASLSERRRALLDRLDVLQDELVRRYRDGGVDTTTLLEGGR